MVCTVYFAMCLWQSVGYINAYIPYAMVYVYHGVNSLFRRYINCSHAYHYRCCSYPGIITHIAGGRCSNVTTLFTHSMFQSHKMIGSSIGKNAINKCKRIAVYVIDKHVPTFGPDSIGPSYKDSFVRTDFFLTKHVTLWVISSIYA